MSRAAYAREYYWRTVERRRRLARVAKQSRYWLRRLRGELLPESTR